MGFSWAFSTWAVEFRVGLRGFFDGGEDGVAGFDGFLKELMDLEMQV